MWKRMQQSKSAKQQTRSVSPAGDENAPVSSLDSMSSQQENSFSHSQSSKPTRGLPALPFEAAEQIQARQGKNRPEPSIYSQHPPGIPSALYQPPATFQDRVTSYEEEVQISPPSSPEIPPKRNALRSHNLPRDERLQAPQEYTGRLSSKQGSNIPVARREKGRNQTGVATSNLARNDGQWATGLKKVGDTRWDDLTGEPTESEQGRLTSVRLGEFTPVVTSLDGAYEPAHSVPKGQTSFGDRVRKLKESNKLGGNRPEWKGSSGRMTIVPTPEDNPNVPPLQIPRKSSKRVPSLQSMGSSRVTTPANETPVASPTAHGGTQYFNPSPVTMTASEHLEPTTTYKDPTSPFDSLPSQRAQAQRHVPVSLAAPSPTTFTTSVSGIERNFHEALKDVSISTPTAPQYREPPQEVSRFSVTTYAPSTNSMSPRPSTESIPPTPVPPIPTKYSNPNPAISPILNRRRPVGASNYAFDSTTAALRQPPVGELRFIGMSHRSSLSKALPKSPEEWKAIDKVTALQAHLDDLARQRKNIDASIHRMTELMPGEMTGLGPRMSSDERLREMARREEEKRKVEALRGDLADVKREEHDVGLKLHRALKKADERSAYEPSGLWVRRVTG